MEKENLGGRTKPTKEVAGMRMGMWMKGGSEWGVAARRAGAS